MVDSGGAAALVFGRFLSLIATGYCLFVGGGGGGRVVAAAGCCLFVTCYC